MCSYVGIAKFIKVFKHTGLFADSLVQVELAPNVTHEVKDFVKQQMISATNFCEKGGWGGLYWKEA